MDITYVIGTDNIADLTACEEVNYKLAVERALAKRFPNAAHIDVVIDNGGSKARVTGLSLDEAIEREQEIIGEIDYIANEVWNRGDWCVA